MSIPIGFCKCGCGKKTGIAKITRTERGEVAGQPLPYFGYHKRRKHPFHPSYDIDENGCWIWRGHLDNKGYGRYHDGKVKIMAHRLMYERKHGEIPHGMMLDHKCRVKTCVNPDHLRVATRSQNAGNTIKRDRDKRRVYTSKYKGVARSKGGKTWKAYICLGTFPTEREAATAYNNAARSIFGEFALLNEL